MRAAIVLVLAALVFFSISYSKEAHAEQAVIESANCIEIMTKDGSGGAVVGTTVGAGVGAAAGRFFFGKGAGELIGGIAGGAAGGMTGANMARETNFQCTAIVRVGKELAPITFNNRAKPQKGWVINVRKVGDSYYPM